MPFPKKTRKIGKQKRKLQRAPKDATEVDTVVELDLDDGVVSETEHMVEQIGHMIDQSSQMSCKGALGQECKEGMVIKRSLRMDPRLISNLPEEERARIRKEHPEMNQYFLMSGREKCKFFHLLNQHYRSQIKLPEPPGSAPMKKTLTFKKRFQIKKFAKLQTCEQLLIQKSFMQLYKAKNGNRPKKLSKSRRNA